MVLYGRSLILVFQEVFGGVVGAFGGGGGGGALGAGLFHKVLGFS